MIMLWKRWRRSQEVNDVQTLYSEWSDNKVINQWRGKDTICAGEQHTPPDHLGHYAANRPHIHWGEGGVEVWMTCKKNKIKNDEKNKTAKQ